MHNRQCMQGLICSTVLVCQKDTFLQFSGCTVFWTVRVESSEAITMGNHLWKSSSGTCGKRQQNDEPLWCVWDNELRMPFLKRTQTTATKGSAPCWQMSDFKLCDVYELHLPYRYSLGNVANTNFHMDSRLISIRHVGPPPALLAPEDLINF